MKTLELEEFNLMELNFEESRSRNGGLLGLFIAGGLAAGLIISAIDHWPDIKNGVMDAINEK